MTREQIDKEFESFPMYKDKDLMCKDFAEHIADIVRQEA